MHWFHFHQKKNEDSFPLLVQDIRRFSDISPSEDFLVRGRKKLLETLQSFPEEVPFIPFNGIFVWKKRAVLGFLAAILLILLPFTWSRTDLLQVTYLQAQGKVFVQRNGENILVEDQMVLNSGDTITTTGDSSAEIYFADDSVTRLSPDTELAIHTLSVDQADFRENVVEVEVKHGRIWSHVSGSLPEESTFRVTASETVAEVVSKAAFDMQVQEEDVKVSVATHAVDVTVHQDEQSIQKLLIEGQELQIQNVNGTSLLALQDVQKDVWMNENLQKDEVYQEIIKEKKQNELEQKAGILSDSPFYSFKKFSENAEIVLTFDSVEKEKKKIERAGTRLLEAETLLSSGNEQAGQQALDEFQDAVAEVKDTLQTLDDQPSAIDIQDSIKENLTSDFSYSHTQENLKEALVSVTEDPEEKNQIHFRFGLQMLFDARDFIQAGKEDQIILEKLKKYREDARSTIRDFTELSDEEQNNLFPTLLEQKIEELMFARVLENVAQDVPSVFSSLERLKVNLLWDVNTLILAYEDRLNSDIAHIFYEQKNDEFVQKSFLRELTSLVSDDSVRNQLKRFEKYYLSNRVVELVQEDQVVTVEFAQLLLK